MIFKMEALIDENVDPADLKKFQQQYNEQVKLGHVDETAEFNYSWCLVRSQYNSDMKDGLALLEELFRKTKSEHAKRDYLYYLSLGCLRLKQYDKAMKYVNGILHVEPQNHQAMQLKVLIEKRMKKEGLIGIAVVGGAAVVGLGAAAIAGLGVLAAIAMAKKGGK